eukprot:13879926-Alexandrium_andersonii.AAC.1
MSAILADSCTPSLPPAIPLKHASGALRRRRCLWGVSGGRSPHPPEKECKKPLEVRLKRAR